MSQDHFARPGDPPKTQAKVTAEASSSWELEADFVYFKKSPLLFLPVGGWAKGISQGKDNGKGLSNEPSAALDCGKMCIA